MTNKSDQAFPKLDDESPIIGLTKHEYIAIAMLQGLLAAQAPASEITVQRAVYLADRLVLEMTKYSTTVPRA